jgi:glycosyltransferase involved in cell wall biosynthesis
MGGFIACREFNAMLEPRQIAVIVATYNRPDALEAVLRGLAGQNVDGFSAVIADDGSSLETRQLIERLQPEVNYPLRHVWQEDQGFRAAAARNRALAEIIRHCPQAEYIVFIDGDSVPPAWFIEAHGRLAEAGCFVAGNRVLCNAEFTRRILREHLPVWAWPLWRWGLAWLRRGINRLSPLLRLPDGAWRKPRRGSWEGVKTCNLGAWLQDLRQINGFDERYQGWGHEDADLAVRLLHAGVKRKNGRYAAPVLHLWHPEHDRSREPANRARLEQVLEAENSRATLGLEQYL